MNPDRRAELEEERRFLLRSLTDLEREHDAGDVDADDYQTLREGYTVRAAEVLRSIDEGRATQGPPPRRWRRHLIAAVVVLAIAGCLGWFVARSSGQRLAGQELSGLDPRDEIQVLLAEARALSLEDPARAAEIYREVVERDPDHVEAVTYYGWTTALAAARTTDAQAAGELLRDAITQLSRATDLDPSYPDPYCFLGIVEYRFLGEPEVALPNVERCLAGGPPADVRDLVESLRAQIEADLAAD